MDAKRAFAIGVVDLEKQHRDKPQPEEHSGSLEAAATARSLARYSGRNLTFDMYTVPSVVPSCLGTQQRRAFEVPKRASDRSAKRSPPRRPRLRTTGLEERRRQKGPTGGR